MNGWRTVWGAAGGLALGLMGSEEVVELAPLRVEAWHFDSLGEMIPADVIRLERAVIRASGARSVPEVLTQMAGVRFSGYSGNGEEGQLAMRGFGENSGLRVLVLVDGQVYNPPDMSGINWLAFDVNELETVEVIRGGQGVLYGNHAVSGVIKLETREAGEELEGSLAAEGGSYGTYRGSLGLGKSFGVGSFRVGATHYQTDGFRDNADSESRTSYLAWKADLSEAGKWRGRWQKDGTEMRFPGPLSFEQLMEDPRQSTSAGNEKIETDSFFGTLNGEGKLTTGEWEVHAGYLRRDRDWALDGTESANEHRRYSMTPRFRISGGKAFLIIGTDLGRDELETREYLSEDRAVVRAWADLKRTTHGGYLFGSLPLDERTEISGGLRREEARTDNRYVRYREEQLRPVLETNRGTLPNPDYRDPPEADPALSFKGPIRKRGWAAELSLVSKVLDPLNVWVGWDRVYRYPSLDETASYQGYPLSDPLNVELDPETGDNWEAGLKVILSNWHLGMTTFHMRLRNEIAYDDASHLNVNLGPTQRQGLEMDLSGNFSRGGVSARLSLVDARFSGRDEVLEGKRLPLVPSVEGHLSTWIRVMDSVRLRYNLQYVSSQFQGNDNTNTYRKIPAHALSHVFLRWDPPGRFSLSLGVLNLFDKVHAVTAYSGGFYPGSGRRFTMVLQYTF